MHDNANAPLIDLRKQVGIVLAKRQAPKIVAQVGAAFDISGSAQQLYTKGIMQRAVNRCFAVAVEFDDNATLDSWAFHDGVLELEPVVESMFGNYTTKHITQRPDFHYGGTSFAPVLQSIAENYYPNGGVDRVKVADEVVEQPGFFGKLFGRKPTVVQSAVYEDRVKPGSTGLKLKDPAYIMLLTDGENGDTTATERFFEKYKNHQMYFQFVGMRSGSRANFGFIQAMAEKFPNVGFYDADMIDELSNADLYENLLSKKFINWYTNVKVA